MAPDEVPEEIRALADARAVSRRERDFETADALRAEIEAAGWRVVDAASLYSLERAAPADVVGDGVQHYGSSLSVPSRLDDPAAGVASVVIVATDWPGDVSRALGALTATAPAETQLVVVANGPSDEQVVALDALSTSEPDPARMSIEVVWTSARLGHAAALNCGIRRCAAPVVLLLDTSVEPRDDLVSALVGALADPDVAVAGPFGLVSSDLRSYEEPPAGITDVVAIEGYAQAFRRSDYVARGPLDEHFAFYRNLDIWWSLVLRDPFAADDDDDETDSDDVDLVVDLASMPRPRRALRVDGLDIVRHEHRGWTSVSEAERDRLSKRNFYRVLKRFATRRDLLLESSPA